MPAASADRTFRPMTVERPRHFLVERYLPSIANQHVDLATRRLDVLAGAGVRHVLTLVVLGEETCLSIFEAPDLVAVRDVNQRAGFDLDRIVEVELVAVAANATAVGRTST
jgi:hypothetical protein